nr:MAG TPA: hypothetical protein [Bacteriophage sp.]
MPIILQRGAKSGARLQVGRCALDLLLILISGAPLNHAGRTQASEPRISYPAIVTSPTFHTPATYQ